LVRYDDVGMAKKRMRIRVEELASLLSVEQVSLLCDFAGGRRIPKPEQFEAWKRRVLVVDDWLNGGCSVRDLSAKYQLSESAVKRMLSIARRKMLRAKLPEYEARTRGCRDVQ
jgi:Mor family transcriptional regulator